MNPKLSPFFIIREPNVHENYRLLYSTRTTGNQPLFMGKDACHKTWQEQILSVPSIKFYNPECLGLNSYFSQPTSSLAGIFRLNTSLKYLHGNAMASQE
jgi:hypothetical protein